MRLTKKSLRELIISEVNNYLLEDDGPTAANYQKSIDVYEKVTPALYEIDGFMKDTGFDSEDGFYNTSQMIIGITALLVDDPKGAKSEDYIRELNSLIKKLKRAHKNLP